MARAALPGADLIVQDAAAMMPALPPTVVFMYFGIIVKMSE